MNKYKTVTCKFYKQHKCLKGDKCTFIHEKQNNIQFKHRISIPISADKQELELLRKMKVYTWTSYPIKVNYEIQGDSQFDIWSYYNIILSIYPENPYFTRHYPLTIYDNSEFDKEYKLLVTRSSTSS